MSSAPVSGLTRRAWSALWYGPSGSRCDGARAPAARGTRRLLAAGPVVQGHRHVAGVGDVRRRRPRSAPSRAPSASSRNEPPPGRAGAAVNVQVCSSTSRAVAGAAGAASPARRGRPDTRSERCSSDTRQARWRCPGVGQPVGHHDANQPSLSPAASSRSSTLTLPRVAEQLHLLLGRQQPAQQRAVRLDRVDEPDPRRRDAAGRGPRVGDDAAERDLRQHGGLRAPRVVGEHEQREPRGVCPASGRGSGSSGVRRTGAGITPSGSSVALPGQRPPAEHDVGQDLVERTLRRCAADARRPPRWPAGANRGPSIAKNAVDRAASGSSLRSPSSRRSAGTGRPAGPAGRRRRAASRRGRRSARSWRPSARRAPARGGSSPSRRRTAVRRTPADRAPGAVSVGVQCSTVPGSPSTPASRQVGPASARTTSRSRSACPGLAA